MGKNEGPRTEVTKELWAYIREHNLQNPKDKREILCDEKLERLFQKKRFTMFQMTKYASEVRRDRAFVSIFYKYLISILSRR